MLSVGIHDNLVISKVAKNEKGSLVIGVKQLSDVDPIAALNAGGNTQLETKEQDFLIFPPQLNDRQGNPDTYDNLKAKLAQIKDPLAHILSAYMPVSAIKWDMFKGTGITIDDISTKLRSESVLTQIYNNIVEQFIAQIKPFVGEAGKRVRMLFVRQSPAKHFPTFRRRFLDSQPFIEPMDVPTSKLQFSKYEVEKGYNSPTPVQQAAAQTVDQSEAQQADALFTN